MPLPIQAVTKILRFIGGKTVSRVTGWVGAAVTIGEIGWFAAKKGKILERFTHYYCEEGSLTCGKMIPDDLIEKSIADSTQGTLHIEVKCPHCPHGKQTIKPAEWQKMKEQRQKWK